MTDCPHTPKIAALHDQEPREEEIQHLREHIVQCEMCRIEWVRLENLGHLLRENLPERAPAGLVARLKAIPRQKPQPELLPVAQLLTCVAVVLFAVCCSLPVLNEQSGPPLSPPVSPTWEEVATSEEITAEPAAQPEIAMAQWVVAGLSQGNNR